MKRILLVITLMFVTGAGAQRDSIVQACAKYSPQSQSLESLSCELYVSGFMDGLITAEYDKKKDKLFCIPDHATVASVAAAVKTNMKRHPEANNAPISIVVTDALVWTFPCTK